MSYEEKIKIYQNMIRNLEIELKHYEGTPYFEDEEFKIRERINMHKEEIRLYAQAAKADEYEAKAKAFDAIFKLYIGYEDGWIYFPRGSKSFNKEIINVCKKYESGESE